MAQRGDSSPGQGPGLGPGRGGAAGDRVDGGAWGDHSQARADPRTRDSPGRWDARRWAGASGEGRAQVTQGPPDGLFLLGQGLGARRATWHDLTSPAGADGHLARRVPLQTGGEGPQSPPQDRSRLQAGRVGLAQRGEALQGAVPAPRGWRLWSPGLASPLRGSLL